MNHSKSTLIQWFKDLPAADTGADAQSGWWLCQDKCLLVYQVGRDFLSVPVGYVVIDIKLKEPPQRLELEDWHYGLGIADSEHGFCSLQTDHRSIDELLTAREDGSLYHFDSIVLHQGNDIWLFTVDIAYDIHSSDVMYHGVSPATCLMHYLQ